jgi:uncharacterized membrane protein
LTASAARAAWLAANTFLLALVGLCLAWELALAPVKPGGSWLALKALPLLAPLFGLLHGRRYTFKWTTLLIWFYAAEGAMRSYGDTGLSAWLAAAELVLALGYYGAAVAYLRATRP